MIDEEEMMWEFIKAVELTNEYALFKTALEDNESCLKSVKSQGLTKDKENVK